MLSDYARNYLLVGLETTPATIVRLLRDYGSSDAVWDISHDDRFTLREVMAHLADWDEVFLQRIKLTLAEDNPTLPQVDPFQMAIDRAYAAQDPSDNIARFAKNRLTLTELLRTLTAQECARAAFRANMGSVTIEEQATLILGHDGYHIKQLLDYTGDA